MRLFLFFTLIFASPSFVLLQAQNETNEDFKAKFDLARNLLLDGKTQKALPFLEELIQDYPNNSNVNYLLGVCYTESEEVNDLSIYYLEKAKKDVTLDYLPNSFLEKKAPIFLYYFLVVAYSQNRLCRKAEDAFYQFHSLYGVQKNDYYVADAKNWLRKCEIPEEIKNSHMDGKPAFQSDYRPVPQPENEMSDKKTYNTKKVEYSTSNSIYGVQVGAYNRVLPVYKFKNLKNIEAFMDNDGMIRYVIGHFTSKAQTEALLKVIKEAGYTDAFIVDVNKERKFTDELIIFNEKSIFKEEQVIESMDYRIQIGAFRDSIPNELAAKYLLVDDISELPQDDLVILTSGKFTTYQDATVYKDQIIQMGIPGAFVIALKNGKKVPISRAMTGKSQE